MLDYWYKHCERVTSTGVYIRELDGLRFLALGMVFLLHLGHAVHDHPGIESSMTEAAESATYWLEFGALGVQVFFAISGFILGMPFARSALLNDKKIPLKKFYQRRLTRLEPPLIIHLSIMLALYCLFDGRSFTEMLPHYGSTVTYLHSHIYGDPSPLNPMTWSLEVEAQFYLLAPLLSLVFLISGLTFRRVVIVGCMLAFGLIENSLPRTLLPVQLSYFLAGFLLADIYLVNWKGQPKSKYIFDVVAVVCVIGFALLCRYHKMIPFTSAWLAFDIFFFFYAVFRSVLFRKIFCNRFLATVGGMCYTFYLYHLIVVITLSRVLRTMFGGEFGYFGTYAIYFVVIGSVNFVICSILFALFERPFMRWRPKSGDWFNGIIAKKQTD